MNMNMNMNQMGGMGGMGAMGATGGMANVVAMAGPGGPTQPALSNTGTPGSAPPTEKDIRTKFHTFIYDYFLKEKRYDLARAIIRSMDIDTSGQFKPSPNRKEVNGVNDSADSDSKEDVKKPDDLPHARSPAPDDSSFLYDWFCQFWDLYEAQRSKGTTASRSFLMGAQVLFMLFSPIYTATCC